MLCLHWLNGFSTTPQSKQLYKQYLNLILSFGAVFYFIVFSI